MRPRIPIAILTLALLGLAAGCGYYNPYVVRQDSKPITVHRTLWNNQTTELGLDTVFLQSMSRWLRKTPLITLKDKAEDAEYIIEGEIVSVDFPETSYGTGKQATQVRADLVVSFSVIERATDKPLWQKKNYTKSETYFTTGDTMLMDTNRKKALAKIADQLAEEIYLHFINTIMRPPGQKGAAPPARRVTESSTKTRTSR